MAGLAVQTIKMKGKWKDVKFELHLTYSYIYIYIFWYKVLARVCSQLLKPQELEDCLSVLLEDMNQMETFRPMCHSSFVQNASKRVSFTLENFRNAHVLFSARF